MSAELSRPSSPQPNPRHSEEYRRYMASEEWRRVSAEAINRAHCRCNRCGGWHYLEVHHRTYERLGHELPQDLEVLCRDCHKVADAERVTQRHVRAYSRRLVGWATKVYGPNENLWPYDVEDRFDDWCERRGDDDGY